MTTLREKPLDRLVDANPRLSQGGQWLRFDCPFHGVHQEWGQCEIAIPLKPEPNGWDVENRDDFTCITVSPSIKVTGRATGCYWHGFVRGGRFEHCGDSR